MYVSTEPLVFILDLDGTIIGDCGYQVCIYNIERILKKNKLRISEENLKSCYTTKSKLIRPFFKLFYLTIKKKYPNSLFYIYTASEKEWANKEISLIEKTHNIKFNRPIFTRKECIIDNTGQYKKSVSSILPIIRKKNKHLNIEDKNILVIDNNPTFIDYNSNFILCPTYDYIHFCDLWNIIKRDHLKISEICTFINELQNERKMCLFHEIKNPCDKTMEMKHKWLYKKHKKINNYNKKYFGDIFWKLITYTLVKQKIYEINHQNIKVLRNTVLNNKINFV